MELSLTMFSWILFESIQCHGNSVSPQISPFKVADNLSEGQRLSLVCLITSGTPPISFSWIKDGNPLNSVPGVKVSVVDEDQEQLKIDRLSREHVGNYTCSAKNALGTDQMSVSVTLKFKPRWINASDEVIETVSGSRALIDCRAIGHPQPIIRVTKGSTEIGATQHVNGLFTIASVSALDKGDYQCEASNPRGKISRRITLSLSGSLFHPTAQPYIPMI